jgi:hypothetical protein
MKAKEKQMQPAFCEQEIYQLAKDLEEFCFDFDTYTYWDVVGSDDEDRDESVAHILSDISKGEQKSICEYLQGIISESDADDSLKKSAKQAKKLLRRLNNVMNYINSQKETSK